MISWFKALDIQGKVGMIFLAIALVIIVIATATHLIDAAFETAEQKGAVTERAAVQAKTLDHLEKAHDATTRYRNDPAVRDADCLRDATNPQDC